MDQGVRHNGPQRNEHQGIGTKYFEYHQEKVNQGLKGKYFQYYQEKNQLGKGLKKLWSREG